MKNIIQPQTSATVAVGLKSLATAVEIRSNTANLGEN